MQWPTDRADELDAASLPTAISIPLGLVTPDAGAACRVTTPARPGHQASGPGF